MPQNDPPRDATALLDALLTHIGHDMPAWLALFAEDAVVDFPYSANPELHGRLEGKAAIERYFARTPEVFRHLAFRDVRRYRALTGDAAVFESHGSARLAPDDRPYQQHYVCIVEARDGLVVRYREYWNPLLGIEAFGSEAALRATMAGERRDGEQREGEQREGDQ